MSEWDFLWGLTGEELDDAMTSGGTKWDWDYVIANQERIESILGSDKEKEMINELHRLALKEEWNELKFLRDTNSITTEDFKMRKLSLFPLSKRKENLNR